MNFQSLIVHPGLATLLGGLAFTSGIVLWWLIRKRRQRVWLPTLRIMELDAKRLPKLRTTPPPWFSFLMFLIAAATFVFFTFRPTEQVFTPFEPNQDRVHVFVDLSPSMASVATIDEVAATVERLVDTVIGQGKVTVSTSYGPELLEPQRAGEVATRIKKLGFHRAGVKLGEAIRRQLADLGEVDRLFVVSDGDRASWDDFNWRFLIEDMEVLFQPVGEGKVRDRANVYINQTTYLSSPDAATMDWDVEIARTRADGAAAGVVRVSYEGRKLQEVPWTLGEGRERATIRVSWPGSELASDRQAAAAADEKPLVWQVATEGGDALALDDEFRSAVRGVKQDVLLIAEPTGEMFLEDPAHHLQVSLEVLGFKVKRLDALNHDPATLAEYPFIIVLGGTYNGQNSYCPVTPPAAQGPQASTKTKIWLVPIGITANYQDLCWCYARLTEANGAAERPDYCTDVVQRDMWISVLSSTGAKQIGGDVGDVVGSLAWHRNIERAMREVTAFTVPLKPSRQTGVTYASLPIIMRSMLTWQGLLYSGSNLKADVWPRIADITSARSSDDAADEVADWRLSNVPLGESLLVDLGPEQLPPRWAPGGEYAGKQMPTKKDREDPLPWIQLCAFLILGAVVVEGLIRGALGLGRVAQGRRSTLLALGLLGGALAGQRAEARVELPLVGYNLVQPRVNNVAREVAGRTSIDMSDAVRVFAEIDRTALSQPWLWLARPGLANDDDGLLKKDVASWLRRGGLLVIENATNEAELEAMTSKLSLTPSPGEGWQVVPPDHELMRSFHLLDALPGCGGQVWRGFQFDGRLAILAVPFSFASTILDSRIVPGCIQGLDMERSTRVFINLLMVALATDYKKDQIHLPEILKRLR